MDKTVQERLEKLAQPDQNGTRSPLADFYVEVAKTLDAAEAEIARRIDVSGLPEDEVEGIRAHVRGLKDGAETYDRPPKGWTCFHCGETFRTATSARLHFGTVDDRRPACVDLQSRLSACVDALRPFAEVAGNVGHPHNVVLNVGVPTDGGGTNKMFQLSADQFRNAARALATVEKTDAE